MPPKKSTQLKQLLGTHQPVRDRARAAEREKRAELRTQVAAKAAANVKTVPIPAPPRELSQSERGAWRDLAATLNGRCQPAQLTRFRNLVGAQAKLADRRLPIASYSSLAKYASKELALLTAPPKSLRVPAAALLTIHGPRASDAPHTDDFDDEEKERRRRLRDDASYYDGKPLPPFNSENYFNTPGGCQHKGHKPDEIWNCKRTTLRLTPLPGAGWDDVSE